jgi:hypothetical protein
LIACVPGDRWQSALFALLELAGLRQKSAEIACG